ncbi:hypothetical protein HN51_064775 [Arachis hypogaea]|uniref:branchpoint-bridging protein isoform X3 n=1 Tax=Arachis ipaensis TaxID=130454 RepID=UPI0007AF4776|nr:branchpoint-bridging protein isoform X3 [Arachis ipaensis]XP_025645611.1 branchpoint-bridging protein isoform X3 [Arachis hypogaea]
MGTKLDVASAAESPKMSAAPSSGQKLSLFAAKSGFVIPKNKLSGSLVPVFRGTKKDGVTGAINEETSKQIVRKTKWGPDLAQDAAVKKAKALALQIRVDQITKQLDSERLEVGSPQNSPLRAQYRDQSNYDPAINSKKSEMLEFEKREAIGEILKLDPNYKPPPGFKPLLKEASISLPVLEYPGYNFIGLIYGPEGDNQKQLEKETGAKIKLHGTKADTGEKGEIKPGTDITCSYKEMYVNISADSFDKVDAAVSIIELLISSVAGNLVSGSTPSVSGDGTNVLSQTQDGLPSGPVSMGLENQAAAQAIAGTQIHGNHLQYSSPWFSAVPSHNPVIASDNMPPQNPSDLARTPNFQSQTMNPSNMPSAFGFQPVPFAGFHLAIPNQQSSVQGLPPRQILQHSQMTSSLGHVGPPRNPSMISVQNCSAPTNVSMSFPVTLSQSAQVGQLQTSGSSMPQPLSGMSPLTVPNRPFIPPNNTSGQNGVTIKMSSDLNSMGPMAPPPRPLSVHPQPDVAFRPLQSNMSMMPRPAAFPPQQSGTSPGLPSSLGAMVPPVPATTHSSANHLSRPLSFPSPGMAPSGPLPQQSGTPNSASGVSSYHTHVKPPVLMPSTSGNFTFQSQRPNADSHVISGPNSQATVQGGIFGAPDKAFQVFPRTQVPNQMDQTQAHASAVPFGGRSGLVPIPPRQAAFPYAGQPGPRSPVPQMGMRNLISPQMPNFPTAGGVPRSPHIQQNYPAPRTWAGIPMPPNHKFGNPSIASGKRAYPADQIYDPFSPTSIAPPRQKGNPGK